MNPYDAPASAELAVDEDDALRRPAILLLAGLATIGAGGFLCATGGQLFWFFRLTVDQGRAATGLVALGLACLVLGPLVLGGRGGPTVMALVSCALGALLAGGWVLYATGAGVVSPLMWFSAGSCGLAAVLDLLAVPSSIRVSRARASLYS